MNFIFTMDDIFDVDLLKRVYKGLQKELLPDDVIHCFLFIVAKHVLMSYTDNTLQGDTFILHPQVKLGPMLAELSMVMKARFDTHEASVPFRMHAFDLANSNLVRHSRIREILQVGNKLYRPAAVNIINPEYGTAYFHVE